MNALAQRGHPDTVLVVDDSEAIRACVRQALEEDGWRVLEAADGAAALVLSEREAERIALILLDVTMPVMDGTQFAEHYWRLETERGDRAPLVVFTADREVEARESAALLCAAAFITKPFDLSVLAATIERHARRAPGVGEAPGPLSPGASPIGKEAARVAAQQRDLVSLGAQVESLRRDLGRLSAGAQHLDLLRGARLLTRQEAQWAAQLSAEGQRLRSELQSVRETYVRLRDERTNRSI
jgi:DNA-binding response OmpR family regulator